MYGNVVEKTEDILRPSCPKATLRLFILSLQSRLLTFSSFKTKANIGCKIREDAPTKWLLQGCG
jgi:hypothetical protein